MALRWRIRDDLWDEHEGTEVADGVYRFGANCVNWYLLDGDDGVTVVDAGLPEHWEHLQTGLDTLGYGLADVEALVLTHADPDHMGIAERLREAGVPVWVHEDDHEAALDGGEDLPLGTFRHLWRPPFLRFVRGMMGAGSGSVPELSAARTFSDGERLAVPGTPEAIHLPGHTPGHCAFWLPDRRVLFVGDALATMDPLRGRACDPEPIGMANTDDVRARESVRELDTFETVTLLPGHGHPWTGDLGDVVTASVAK